jgi:hypothetical protein
VIAGALFARDLHLERRGGGVTPRWLLRSEILASGATAVAAVVAMEATTPALVRRASVATAIGGVAVASIHLVRLAMYLAVRHGGSLPPEGSFAARQLEFG